VSEENSKKQVPGQEPASFRKGRHNGCSNFILEVKISVDEKGNVITSSNLQDSVDRETVKGLGLSDGMAEASFGLLVEAVRQEAWIQGIILANNQTDISPLDFAKIVKDGDLTVQDTLTKNLISFLGTSISKIGPEIVAETLKTISEEMLKNN
jgi:predicted transcriptional regulator